MQHCLFAWFHGSLDWGSFDVVVKVTGKKVGQHQGGQQIDGVTWLAVDLICTSCHSFGRLLIGVVLFFNDNTKPKKVQKCLKLQVHSSLLFSFSSQPIFYLNLCLSCSSKSADWHSRLLLLTSPGRSTEVQWMGILQKNNLKPLGLAWSLQEVRWRGMAKASPGRMGGRTTGSITITFKSIVDKHR